MRRSCSAAKTSTNRAYVLYTLPERRDGMTVDVTLSLTGHDGTARPVELPGWHRRPVELQCFDASGDGSLRAARPIDTRFVLTLDAETDLFPSRAGDDDPYGFGHLFLQQLRVELRLIEAAEKQSQRPRRRSTSPTSGASARCTAVSSSES